MPESIFDRRFVIVAGKGGVGKSTISAALALSAARQGKRVLVCELGSKERVAGLLGHPEPIGYDVVEVADGVEVINVTPEPALHEYGVIKLRFERLYRVVFENPIMQSLIRMIPGMKELLLIGKAWYLEQELDERGDPRWDIIIVDSPATGHGISLLELPHVVTETVKVGPMADEVRTIRDMLTDPKRTVMNVVTLPEEMPTAETLELRARMDDTLRIAPGLLFANGIWPRGMDEDEDEIVSRFREGAPKTAAPFDGAFETMRFLSQRREAQQEYLDRLEAEANMELVHVPYLFTPTFGRGAIDRISAVIDATMGAT